MKTQSHEVCLGRLCGEEGPECNACVWTPSLLFRVRFFSGPPLPDEGRIAEHSHDKGEVLNMCPLTAMCSQCSVNGGVFCKVIY